MKNTCITNGKPMYDVNGKRINIQFPNIIYINEKYYLYGSNKEFSKGPRQDGKNMIWHWGIKAYESDDLYNWKDVGLIIPPDENDPTSPFFPENTMDSPRIVYNKKTNKYVCWIVNMFEQAAYSYVSDSFTGPYIMVGKKIYPCGFRVGDLDVGIDLKDNAYLFFNNPHR